MLILKSKIILSWTLVLSEVRTYLEVTYEDWDGVL